MEPRLHRETENLARSWMQYEPEMLRDYLVAGVEDPRINVQSILTRHFLIVALFGNRFQKLMEHELRFAVVLNWVDAVLKKAADPEDLLAIRHGLLRSADDAEGLPIPRFVMAVFSSLPAAGDGVTIPNYISQLLDQPSQNTGELAISPDVLNSFQRAWQEVLSHESPSQFSVVEPACGSANDYRFFVAYGLARLINYTGFDLCEKNARNARELFPENRFLVGNAFAMSFQDRAFDYVMVHDLFEHLSAEAMELALAEVCRVSRKGLCLGFFNVYEGEEHLVQPTDDYHWNRLSLPRIREFLERHGFTTTVIHIDTFLRWRFGCDQTHNKNAYTVFAERQQLSFHQRGAVPGKT